MSAREQEVYPFEISGGNSRKGIQIVMLGERGEFWSMAPLAANRETAEVAGLLRVAASASQADVVKATKAWVEASCKRLKLAIADFRDETSLYKSDKNPKDIVQMSFVLKQA